MLPINTDKFSQAIELTALLRGALKDKLKKLTSMPVVYSVRKDN